LEEIAMPTGFHEIQVEDLSFGKFVHLTFVEKLAKDDYERFVPMLEGMIDGDTKIRILAELKDFSEWTGGALLEEAKMSLKHSEFIERLAIVGDTTWLGGLAMLAKPFTKVRFFDDDELTQARDWLLET
jgi:hypothetical protein